MKPRWLLLALVLGMSRALIAQQEDDVLWMPEGYRLLSKEERQSLPPDELKAVGTRNTELLRAAVKALTPEERQELAGKLQAFNGSHELADVERQYITMASMMLLSAAMEAKILDDRAADQKRFDQLLEEQEKTTKGFPGEREPVEAEADAIEELMGKQDSRALYLRALKPLRARPWNDAIRVCFRKIVRGNSYPGRQSTSLYDAAIVFLHARQAETPAEGSWYSLEAFLRLSMRGEVPEARRLFAIANAKHAKDVECITFPILLAEIDGDQAEVERLMPRAREAWPKKEDLDRNLMNDIDVLPVGLQARARDTFGGKFRKDHPADWSTRAELMASALSSNRPAEVENEASTLLALPYATLPEPNRSEIFALQLRAKAALGKCDEVAVEIPRFEAAANAAYRTDFDPNVPPRPRSAGDVAELRHSLQEGRQALQQLKASLADGSLEKAAEWGDTPKEERRKEAERWVADLEKNLAKFEAILNGRDDKAAAAAWSREELAAWRAAHHITDNSIYDLAGRAERLSIAVRAAEGICYLDKGRPADAARILAPCIGSGQNAHGVCAEPMVKAGHALVARGQFQEAGAVYAKVVLIENYSSLADDIYQEIEKASPGTVKRVEQTPRPPMPTVVP